MNRLRLLLYKTWKMFYSVTFSELKTNLRLFCLSVRITAINVTLATLIVILLILFPFFLKSVVIDLKLYKKNAGISIPERIEHEKEKLESELKAMDKKLSGKIPRSYYLIINSSSNEFKLMKGRELIRQDKCSTGSYVLLKSDQQQQWMFKTPKGEFRIQGKTTSPVWRKPDWAFVEEGLPVPPADHHSRYEAGVLGDYALSIGQGYLIHGTLYQRFLGLPVTHGCIRLNDENLEMVYRSLSVGSKVYIY